MPFQWFRRRDRDIPPDGTGQPTVARARGKESFVFHDLKTRDSYEKAMQIILNGEPRTAADGLSVEGLIKELGVDARKVAVERNLEIVPKSAFAATALAEGDRLEIVHFIGGG